MSRTVSVVLAPRRWHWGTSTITSPGGKGTILTDAASYVPLKDYNFRPFASNMQGEPQLNPVLVTCQGNCEH